jgi:MSHA pilin protein MshD
MHSMPNSKLQTRNSKRRKSVGVSLVELIVFIVIVGVAVAGVVGALNMSTRASVDPMTQQQALAIAEAILEEVQLQPFTYCDSDDPQAATALNAAVGPAGCSAAAAVEAIGPEGGAPYGPETRAGATTPFDNVNDYQVGGATGPGLVINPISSLDGTAIAGLTGYSANVRVAAQALGAVPASEALLITVTVTGPANTTVVLDGYRVRYAPNALP